MISNSSPITLPLEAPNHYRELENGLYRSFGEGQWRRVVPKAAGKIKPKDASQVALLDLLFDDSIPLVVGLGPAGTGKTLLTMAWALEQGVAHKQPIVLTKPACFIGSARAFGPVPGDVKEKLSPFLASYRLVLKQLLGNNSESYLDLMERKHQLQYVALEYVRGCSFDNTLLVVDEVQNLSWHELKTICSRIGQGSKLVLLGDLDQIDTRMQPEETGISRFTRTRSFQGSTLTGVVTLERIYRSPIAELVCQANREMNA